MINKLFASLTVAGVICGYAAMLYALVHMVVALNQSYLLSLAL